MAAIALERVSKVYPNGETAIRDLELFIDDGDLVVLVGPSGCGKSTTLRLIAGLETPTSGRILIAGRDVTAIPPQDRDLAMVFQSYALYPHKTVRQNLAFGLRMRAVPRAVIDQRIARAAQALGIETLLDRKPAQLSGGQRQRVALGRAIVREPQAFLFDEPLSNLDPRLRVQARTELTLLHRRLAATIVHVTHDQEEAMTLGDRIAVLRAGELQQFDSPAAVYREPANTFVATFIGSPEINLFDCRVEPHGETTRIATPAFALSGLAEAARLPRGQLVLGVRPHDIAVASEDSADARGTVELVELLGSTVLVHVRATAEGPAVRVLAPADAGVRVDDAIGLRFDRAALHFFDADGLRIPLRRPTV
jgi:ABC-type sugar transport system ATPase subunit